MTRERVPLARVAFGFDRFTADMAWCAEVARSLSLSAEYVADTMNALVRSFDQDEQWRWLRMNARRSNPALALARRRRRGR